MLKPPGTKRLKLKGDKLTSTSGFNFNVRHYHWVDKQGLFDIKVRWCRLTWGLHSSTFRLEVSISSVSNLVISVAKTVGDELKSGQV